MEVKLDKVSAIDTMIGVWLASTTQRRFAARSAYYVWSSAIAASRAPLALVPPAYIAFRRRFTTFDSIVSQ
jgi:hypothetical protein